MRRIPTDWTRQAPESHHFCGRCIEPISTDCPACPSCETSFAGAGRFLRMSGPRPLVAPARRPWAGATRLAAR